MKKSEPRLFVRYVSSAAMLSALLVFAPVIMRQHLAGIRPGGFSEGHAGVFSGGGFRGGLSAPHSIPGFTAPALRSFGAAPRMNLTAPRYFFAPQRNVLST